MCVADVAKYYIFPLCVSFFSLSLLYHFFFLTSCIFSRQQRQQRQHGVMPPSGRQHLRQQNLRCWQQKSCIRYAKWRYNAICSVLPVKEQAATLQRQHLSECLSFRGRG